MSKISFVYKHDASAGAIPAEVHFSAPDSQSSPRPIVLVFHAGGFAAGSIAMVPPAEIRALIGLGFVVAVVAYRLCPQVSLLEGPLADARDCLAWARTELPAALAKEGVTADGRKVVAMGHSAGGGMSLYLGSLPDPPAAIADFYGVKYLRDPFWHTGMQNFAGVPDPDDAVCARVFEGGAVPLASSPMFVDGKPDLATPRIAWMLKNLKHGTWAEGIVKGPRQSVDEKAWDEAEPTQGFAKGFPPTCFVQGDQDQSTPVALARRAHEELSAKGVETELVVFEGAPHLFDAELKEDDPVFQDKVMKGLQFLRKYV